jgi:hypothetical protein
MSVTVDGAGQPRSENEAGASATPGADETAEATYPVVEDERQRISRKRIGAGAAALVGFGAGALAAGMIAARRDSELTLRPGEKISMRAQPRKGVWRYILTCGLWELDRRATQFTLTNQRLVIEKGLLHRVVNAVPLGDVQRVIVRTGPFEGTVAVSTFGAGGLQQNQIGPLAVSSARSFVRALARAGDDVEVTEVAA